MTNNSTPWNRCAGFAAACLLALAIGNPSTSAAAGPAPIAFARAKFYDAGWLKSPSLDNNGTAIADFDNDGHDDVTLVAPWEGSRVVVMWGTGTGSFRTPGQVIWAGLLNSNVIAGDYNGDGRPDFVVTGASTFTVVSNDGGRRFRVGKTYLLQGAPFQNTGVAADYDGDGILDLALKTPLGIEVMLGNGNATFDYGPFTTIPGTFPGGITSVDDANLDGDAHHDLVLSDGLTQQVFGLAGRGDGSFEVIDRESVPLLPSTVRAGDLDSSGLDSVVVLPEVNPGSISAAILINDGTGGFYAPEYYPAGFADPVGELADFNGDGHLDILAVNTFSGDLVVLAGRGDGTFVSAGSFATSLNAQTPVTGDFNEDGRIDIAVPVNCPGLAGKLGAVCLAVLINQSY